MSIIFSEHLEELRKTLLKCLFSMFCTWLIGWFLFDPLFKFLLIPLSKLKTSINLITVAPLDAFLLKLKLSIFIGILLSSPVIIYLIWNFVEPGLKTHEKKVLKLSLFSGLGCLLAGCIFGYQILNLSLNFLIKFTPYQVQPFWRVDTYLGFAFQLMTACGIVFELPVLIFILIYLKIVSALQLSKARPYFIVGSFVMAAILTPPDILSQILLAVPLILLYELGLLTGRFFIDH